MDLAAEKSRRALIRQLLQLSAPAKIRLNNSAPSNPCRLAARLVCLVHHRSVGEKLPSRDTTLQKSAIATNMQTQQKFMTQPIGFLETIVLDCAQDGTKSSAQATMVALHVWAVSKQPQPPQGGYSYSTQPCLPRTRGFCSSWRQWLCCSAAKISWSG